MGSIPNTKISYEAHAKLKEIAKKTPGRTQNQITVRLLEDIIMRKYNTLIVSEVERIRPAPSYKLDIGV